MASAPTVLLCCWLAGHSGAQGQREFPKPLVGGSPRWVVAPGENLSIRCEGRFSGLEFLLHKGRYPNLQQRVVSAGTVAEFPLPSVGRADAGSYTCEYRPTTEPTRWSHLSDPVEIIVAEPSDPKPSISLSPSGGVSLGASVGFRCLGQHKGRRFVLKTAGGQFLHKDSGGFGAEFSLSPLRREQGGSYSCSYHSKSEPFTVSYPSDPVELVLRDPSLPRPSVSLSPTWVAAPGSDVTIRCQGPGGDVRFFLHQAGDLTRPRPMDPAGDGAEFHIRPVGRQHGGKYSCSYRSRAEPFVSSAPSDPVGLVIAEPTLPRPSISISPSRGVRLGAAATIRCRAGPQNATFLLYKDGGYWGRAAPVGHVAEFPVAGAGWEDAGNYSCSYHTSREPVALSRPSDPARLVVRDYTRGNIVRLALAAGVVLGLALILAEIWPGGCRERGRATRRLPGAAAPARFLIPLPLGAQGGCSWTPGALVAVTRGPHRPAMASASTIFFLSCWLAGHSGARGPEREFPKPLVGGSPRWVVALGENVSIRCEGRFSGAEFLLHKAGHPNMYQRVVSAGTVAEFPLPSVGRADAGSYTCDYRPTTEPTRWSHPSDPLELVVAEPSDRKPSISLSPSGGVSLGGAVTVQCWGQRLGRLFVLKTAGGQFLHKDPGGFGAEFPLSPLRREQGGSYSCSYHSRSEPFTVSYPSDPVELVLRDPSLPRPSVSLSPTGVTVPGADVTIRCQGPGGDVRFFLHQAGDLTRPRPMDPAGDGAEFHVRPVGRQHGGSNSCSYRPRAEPFVSSAPSDPVGLVIAGETDLTQPGAAPDPTRAGPGAWVRRAGKRLSRGRNWTPAQTPAPNSPASGTNPTSAPQEQTPTASLEHQPLGTAKRATPALSALGSPPCGASAPRDRALGSWGGCIRTRNNVTCCPQGLTPLLALQPPRAFSPRLPNLPTREQLGYRSPQCQVGGSACGMRVNIGGNRGGGVGPARPRRPTAHRAARVGASPAEPEKRLFPCVRLWASLCGRDSQTGRCAPLGGHEGIPGGAQGILCGAGRCSRRDQAAAGGCGLLGAAGRWLCSARGGFGLEVAEKPSDGEERGRATRRLPGASPRRSSSFCSHSGWVQLGTGASVVALTVPHCPAMASAPTVLLLSCWLAGHSGAQGQREYPKPLVGGSPSWVVAPGENVSIRCEGWYSDVEFLLRKAGHLNLQRWVETAGTVAEFPLPSVGRADAGSYTCQYHPTTAPTRWSHPSDPLELVVAEPSDPKPSISLSSSGWVTLGGAVSIWCWGQRLGRRFVLKTAGGQFLHKDPDGFVVEFPLSSLRREQGGSYSCSYHSRSEPFTVSYPSDPVELVLTDPSLPKPSISSSATWVTVPGADVTIWCQGPGGDVRFFLHQAGDLTQPRPMDPAGDRAEFHIRPVGRQHGGSYSCSYRPRAEPFVSSPPSDPMGLVVAGETDLTQPRAAPDPTRPGSVGAGTGESIESPITEGLGPPTPSSLSTPLIAGVSVAAIGLLLLLLAAFVCFARTRARKGDAPRPSSTIPLRVLKAPAQQDPVYASVDEGKQPQSLTQEPDPGAEGLTYAELDHQALHHKRGAPAPAPELVLYAAVSRSQGARP
ncbi:uncharacterized protein LOC112545992 [Pelodiscus sinensis]|uniref:uncharacterized protein LOC112545992 n=1 Tax=Pelodiscus sinensis TaxID=13735 RepID=UPI003F6AAD99